MATKSKHRKNHKQKVEARKKRVEQQKRQTEKMQREFIMNLIKQEQEKGAFENTLNFPADTLPTTGPILDGPVMDSPVMTGPIIDGPIIDGPIIESQQTQTPMISEVEVVDVVESGESISSEENSESN